MHCSLVLQTVSIRFHRSNELTRYFNIDGIGEDMTEPIFLFIPKGSVLGDSFDHEGKIHATKDRASFETWMWSMIQVKVIFYNLHDHPVEIYWMTGNQANYKDVIQPRTFWTHYSMLTHEVSISNEVYFFILLFITHKHINDYSLRSSMHVMPVLTPGRAAQDDGS